MWRLTLPVREVRVIRNASVQVSAEDAWGGRSRFTFADRGLTLFEGARAAVSFDPADPAETAVVELAERFADFPAGTLLAGAAVRVDARPRIVGGRTAWVSGAPEAARERKAARRLVAEAVRTFDERGAVADRGERGSGTANGRECTRINGGQGAAQGGAVADRGERGSGTANGRECTRINGGQGAAQGGAPQPPEEFYHEPDWETLERRAGLIA